jgi:hypothetical protein
MAVACALVVAADLGITLVIAQQLKGSCILAEKGHVQNSILS